MLVHDRSLVHKLVTIRSLLYQSLTVVLLLPLNSNTVATHCFIELILELSVSL